MSGTFTNRIIFTRYLICILHTGTSRIIISHIAIVTRSLVCICLQNCQKRRTKRRTALNNIIAETSLPVTRYDTSFETLINTRQHTIENIVRDALRQHGYRRVYLSIIVNRCKFISSLTFLVSLIPLLYILQIRSHSTKRRRHTRT